MMVFSRSRARVRTETPRSAARRGRAAPSARRIETDRPARASISTRTRPPRTQRRRPRALDRTPPPTSPLSARKGCLRARVAPWRDDARDVAFGRHSPTRRRTRRRDATRRRTTPKRSRSTPTEPRARDEGEGALARERRRARYDAVGGDFQMSSTDSDAPDAPMATEEAAPAPGVRVRELRASFAGALRACVELPTAQVRRARTTRDLGWFPRETTSAGRRARDARDESDDGRERDE